MLTRFSEELRPSVNAYTSMDALMKQSGADSGKKVGFSEYFYPSATLYLGHRLGFHSFNTVSKDFYAHIFTQYFI
jgi:hypothetical protein